MRDAVMLTHRIPFPPNKGDKIRSYHLLRYLAQDWRVHLGCFADDPEDLAHVDALREICAQVFVVPIQPRLRRLTALGALVGGRPLTFDYYASSTLASWLEEVRAERQPSLEYAFSSGVAPYLFGARSRQHSADTLRVVDLVDLDSEKWRAYAHGAGLRGWIYRLEARRLAAAELALTQAADFTLLVSEAEASELRTRPGARAERVQVVGNGVDLEYFDPAAHRPHPQPSASAAPALVFTGAMDYRPNFEGAVWFAEQVWPRLAAAHPDLRWWIVGARPDPRIQALRSLPRVTVTGSVADVRPWLAHATLAVIPLRFARGIQNKLLEALAMQRAVVATPMAAAGVDPATRTLLRIANEPEHFATAILSLLDDPLARSAMGIAGRRSVEKRYRWFERLSVLDHLLASAPPERGASALHRINAHPTTPSGTTLRPAAPVGRA